MKLIIVRHGKTIENEKGIMQGQGIGGTLSQLGIKQAKELAEKLKNETINKIYSSDLKRCMDTTNEIIKFHKNIPIVLVKDLRERDFGEFTGIKKEDLGIDKNKLVGDILNIKQGEQIKEVIERVAKFLEGLKEKHIEKNILIVGHNTINKIIISLITNKSLKQIKPQDNTEINIFEF